MHLDINIAVETIEVLQEPRQSFAILKNYEWMDISENFT